MSCNIKPAEINYYIPSNKSTVRLSVDQNVVVKKDILKNIPLKQFKAESEPSDPLLERYPCTNSYYQYTEDVDAFGRVNALLADRPSYYSIPSSNDFATPIYQDLYSETEAQQNYLQSQPVSFIILGKPDIGQELLGRRLADFWGCVYIEPQTLILEEIESGSRAGQCIEFNLRCGRAVGIDVILKLVEKRVKSDSAQHRGFVFCGLPVIPNDLYEEDPVSSESAVFTVQDIFEETFESAVELILGPKQPQVSVSSKFQSELSEDDVLATPEDIDQQKIPTDVGPDFDICGKKDIGEDYDAQLNFLFDLLKEPYIIIYVKCGTLDVINMRDKYRFDVYSSQTIDLQKEEYNKCLYKRLSHNPENGYIRNEYLDFYYIQLDPSRLKHLSKLPRDFKGNVATQLDRYHSAALHHIDRRVLMHDPEYFIKVDGRTNIEHMLDLIKTRLKILPLPRVILPRKLDDPDDDLAGEALPGEGKTAAPITKDVSIDDCIRDLCKRYIPSSAFKWTLSDWGKNCPVALSNGYTREGKPAFAIQFMNKIFFLSNYMSFLKFYRNPRPFLLPPYPRTTCKICIFGPPRSNRTSLAICLMLLYNGTRLVPDDILKKFIEQEFEERKENIRQCSRVTALQLLTEQHREEAALLEMQRIQDIKDWLRQVIRLIEAAIPLLAHLPEESKTTLLSSSFPMDMTAKKQILEENDLDSIKDRLHELNLPCLGNEVKAWECYLKEKRKLLQYLPENMKHKVVPKPANVFDEFVIDYVNRAVKEADLDSDLDDLIKNKQKNIEDLFRSSIKDAEEKYMSQGYPRGGWILDGMFTNVDMIESLYPDYIGDDIIILTDNDDNSFLKEQFEKGYTDFTEYQEFFRSIGKTDALYRCPSRLSSPSLHQHVVRDVLSNILVSEAFDEANDDGEKQSGLNIRLENYENQLHKYQASKQEIIEFLRSRKCEPIIINVANKTHQELFSEVIKVLEDKHKTKAVEYTEEDRAEEVKVYGDQKVNDDLAEDEMMTNIADDGNSFEENRRYGDTSYYCPVTYQEKWVLWKGKEDFAVKFEDKVYLLSSESDMKLFLKEPRRYLTGKRPEKIPPPRICITGVPGVGKSTVSKAIAENYGLVFVSYEDFLKKKYKIQTDETLEEIKNNQQYSNWAIYKYLTEGESLPEYILRDIGKYWCSEPNRSIGFVFDDFPKRPSDIEFMVKYKLIPDVVIELIIDKQTLVPSVFTRYLNRLDIKIEVQRKDWTERNMTAIVEREEMRKMRCEELIEERRQRRYALMKQKMEEEQYTEGELQGNGEDGGHGDFKVSTQVSLNSVAEQEDEDEVRRILDEELPPLIFEFTDHNSEENKAKILETIDRSYDTEQEYVTSVKELCQDNVIDFFALRMDIEKIERNRMRAFLATEKYKFRTMSFFERCYNVSMEVSERLLACGYFFLSKFGRTCPVQYYENKNPFQLYYLVEQKLEIYPVIHRSYIYFLSGRSNRAAFRSDPLKYISVNFRFPLIPLKVGVTGPPKCGKTILARRISEEYGMKLISRGSAARYVLDYLPHSNLAENMEIVLRKGWELTDEMVAACVEASLFDTKAITEGSVFDGFPNIINEVRHLSLSGLVPNLVIDLQATKTQIFECLSYDSPRGIFPRYSQHFISYLYGEWLKEAKNFRRWFDREYQISTTIPINTSNWSIWWKSRGYITTTLWEIKHYFVHIIEDWPVRLGNMQVTPIEFLERQSSYKTFCPVCIHFWDTLTSGGDPPDRTGLIQFRKYFYWICSEHIQQFLDSPNLYLPPYCKHSIPQYFPTRVKLNEMPNNVYEGGLCVVCYQTKIISVAGVLEYAVSYVNDIYLFDSEYCMNTFLKTPKEFNTEIGFRPPPLNVKLGYEELPVLGMLEQYIAKHVLKAVCFVARRRPVLPGLSITTSALIGIGLYLKVHDIDLNKDYIPYYKEGFELYIKRMEDLLRNLNRLKSVINPYLYYEEPMPPFRLPVSECSSTTEPLTTTVSRIIDDIVDDCVSED